MSNQNINIDEIIKFKPNLYQKVWWLISRFVCNIPFHIREIKWFFQRGRRGWADCDVWSTNDYLAKIIPSMLKQLKVTTHGYPGYGKANTSEKWDKLLDSMIEGWEAANRVCNDEYYELTGFPEKRSEGDVKVWQQSENSDVKIFNERMKVFIKFFFHLWD